MDLLTVTPGSPAFLLIMAATLGLLALLTLALRGKDDAVKARVLSGIMGATFVLFWYYKWKISQDGDYAALKEGLNLGDAEFSWWSELPLQLCNINIVLVPLAVFTKKRPLLSFCALVGPLGALMALVMPGVGFDGYSILLPRIWGYYATHCLVLFGCLAVLTLKLYRPRYSDLLPCTGMTLALSFLIFLINLLLRFTGLYPYSNYFFNVETEGNAILELAYGLVPVPYLYQIPLTLILMPYMAVMITAFRERKRK